MTDPEKLLSAAPLAKPSAPLDERMAAIFDNAKNAQRSPRGKMIKWPLIGFLCASGIAAALVFLMDHPSPNKSHNASSELVYSIESHGLARQMLLDPHTPLEPTHFEVSIETD